MSAKILALVDDMFFSSKIVGTAESLGLKVDFVKGPEELIERSRRAPPALIVCDLNSTKLKPLEAISALKSDPQLSSILVIGFLSHVQVDLKEHAIRAGCDQVMPRSAFSRRLPELLSKL